MTDRARWVHTWRDMSQYFDQVAAHMSARIKDCGLDETTADENVRVVNQYEDLVEADSLLLGGDVDTSRWVRAGLMEIAAKHKLSYGGHENERVAEAVREGNFFVASYIEELHSFMHKVASARIETRYGLISDSLSINFASMDAWLEEKYGTPDTRTYMSRCALTKLHIVGD
jgi:hypothetical protein